MVGIGPGNPEYLTQRARQAIKESQVIVGYKTYLKLLGNLTFGKEVISSGMTQEVERAKYAIKKAQDGQKVCVVSGGDPGIYGMAGIVLELLFCKEENKVSIEVIPGIPAASSCASLLGSPLMHDFVTISLSDILTDKKLIEKRVALACQGDFVIVFYNPKSRKRTLPLNKAWQILMKYKSGHTPVGIVRNAYRYGQEIEVMELKDMLSSKIIDMFTTIIVGNAKTYVRGNFMITPRGYKISKGR